MANLSITLGTYALGTQTAINNVKILTSRRLQQFSIIRDDTTIIPLGMQKPLNLSLKGTIVGSDYTSLRTALRDLRNAVESSKRDFSIDNDRFVNVISKSFDYAYITKDFANFNINFMSELPYFLANTESTDIRGPVSGSTYIITNNGDVRIPLKIGFTASTLGLSDNLRIENRTSGSLCKFRGSLTATETLIVDTGFANGNKPQFLVELEGVSAMSAFEGDFIWLESGTNEIVFTGEIASTVQLTWREGFLS